MEAYKGCLHDEKPEELVYWPTSVDVNVNIEEVEVEDTQTGEKTKKWQCDTERYTYEEYITKVKAEKDEEIEQARQDATNLQIAMAEVFEMCIMLSGGE